LPIFHPTNPAAKTPSTLYDMLIGEPAASKVPISKYCLLTFDFVLEPIKNGCKSVFISTRQKLF